ncbi:MAG: phosphatidylglycerophosphatase A [Candidatus Acidiferrales bacterium]|jgi:phosphatidylglycerophosphatase A
MNAQIKERTDAPVPSAAGDAASRKPAVAGKPRFALFVATACGLGYIPKAPGTFGSLAGLLLAILPMWVILAAILGLGDLVFGGFGHILLIQWFLVVVTAALGVWSANRAAEFWSVKDPQRVVVDEVSGQHLTLVLGCSLPIARALPENVWSHSLIGLITPHTALSWKYLLLGFILFRAFDIWKPFPVRQAESLPGGWGIMADDWVAAIYAGLGLWIARAAGL